MVCMDSNVTCFAVVYTDIHVIQSMFKRFESKNQLDKKHKFKLLFCEFKPNEQFVCIKIDFLQFTIEILYTVRHFTSNNHLHSKETHAIMNRVVQLLAIFSQSFHLQ